MVNHIVTKTVGNVLSPQFTFYKPFLIFLGAQILLTLLEVGLLILGTTNYSTRSKSSDSCCYVKLQHHLIGNASINELSGLSLP